MTRLTPKEVVERFRTAYENEIKPEISRKNYFAAACIIGNHNFAVGDSRAEIIGEVHCGLAFLAAGRLLEQMLDEGKPEKIERAQEAFEAYLAQTKLPRRPS